MSNKGFLEIWCEIGADDLADYRAWITKEHIADRTFLPGWLGARFCTDVTNELAHFFLYATEDKSVFSAEPYLNVLNNPSPWTRRIMPKFGPFDRALGEQLFKLGNGYGAYMMVSRIRDASVINRVLDELDPIKKDIHAVMVLSLETESDAADVHTRMFAPKLGIPEDPATGSASGGLGAYLIENRIIEATLPTTYITAEQGIEAGRPSTLYIEVDGSAGDISMVRVGGEVVPLIEGVMSW